MTDSGYLKLLAQSSSIEEFRLKCAIYFSCDDMYDFEKDYMLRMQSCRIYHDEFLKDRKFSLEDAIHSKLPILIGVNKETDKYTGIETQNIKFYDHTGSERNVSFNTELPADLNAIYGIDIGTEIYNVLRYELEKSK